MTRWASGPVVQFFKFVWASTRISFNFSAFTFLEGERTVDLTTKSQCHNSDNEQFYTRSRAFTIFEFPSCITPVHRSRSSVFRNYSPLSGEIPSHANFRTANDDVFARWIQRSQFIQVLPPNFIATFFRIVLWNILPRCCLSDQFCVSHCHKFCFCIVVGVFELLVKYFPTVREVTFR